MVLVLSYDGNGGFKEYNPAMSSKKLPRNGPEKGI